MIKFLFLIVLLQGICGQLNITILPKHDVVFGIDFLGWGFDISTSRDPFYALKPPLFDYSYSQNPTGVEYDYRYPTDTVVYSVPDQVFVRTVARTTTDTYIFDSSEQEQMSLDITLGLQGATSTVQGSLKFDFNLLQVGTTDQHIIRNEVQTQLFQLYLGPNRVLKQLFLQRLGNLTQSYAVDPQDWDLFIDDFGTHYVDSVIVGGALVQRTIVTSSNNSQTIQFSIALEGRYQGTNPGTTATGSLNVNYQQSQSYVDTQTISASDILGGAPEFTDFVLRGGATDATQQLFSTWKSTLTTNPVTIRYRLVDIWTLATPLFARQQLCQAVAVASGFTTSQEISAYCSGNPLLQGGSISASLP